MEALFITCSLYGMRPSFVYIPSFVLLPSYSPPPFWFINFPILLMRCCRSDWPGLWLFSCFQPLCVVSQQCWIWAKCPHFTPPPDASTLTKISEDFHINPNLPTTELHLPPELQQPPSLGMGEFLVCFFMKSCIEYKTRVTNKCTLFHYLGFFCFIIYIYPIPRRNAKKIPSDRPKAVPRRGSLRSCWQDLVRRWRHSHWCLREGGCVLCTFIPMFMLCVLYIGMWGMLRGICRSNEGVVVILFDLVQSDIWPYIF